MRLHGDRYRFIMVLAQGFLITVNETKRMQSSYRIAVRTWLLEILHSSFVLVFINDKAIKNRRFYRHSKLVIFSPQHCDTDFAIKIWLQVDIDFLIEFYTRANEQFDTKFDINMATSDFCMLIFLF